MIRFIIFQVLVSIAFSCKHAAVVPADPSISFSKQVQPIINSNCAMSGCHDGKSKFDLYTYHDIYMNVTPGDAANSRVYTSIVDRSMPPSSPLTDEQAKLIYIWIMQGAPNN